MVFVNLPRCIVPVSWWLFTQVAVILLFSQSSLCLLPKSHRHIYFHISSLFVLPLVSTRLTQELIRRQQFRRPAIRWISIQHYQEIPHFWTKDTSRFELTPPSWWCVGHRSARCTLIRGGRGGKGWWSRGAWNGPTDDYRTATLAKGLLASSYCQTWETRPVCHLKRWSSPFSCNLTWGVLGSRRPCHCYYRFSQTKFKGVSRSRSGFKYRMYWRILPFLTNIHWFFVLVDSKLRFS